MFKLGSGGLVFVAEERGLNSKFQDKRAKKGGFLAGKRERGRTGRKSLFVRNLFAWVLQPWQSLSQNIFVYTDAESVF